MVLPYELRSETAWSPKVPKFPPVSPPIYMGFERKKETIEDIMLEPKKNQMFNRWNVPDRMMDAPMTPMGKPLSPEASVPPTPMSARTPLPIKPASRMSREMSLPNIALQTKKTPRAESRVESRNGLQTSRSSVCGKITPRLNAMPQRSKTMFVDTRKKSSEVDENGVPLGWALKPEAVPQAEEWMKNADKADKKVIERIIKMASKKNELDHSLRKTLLPDAKDTVDKWLTDANEGERQVALGFFNSLAGSQLMGMTVDSQRKRLKEVLNTLEDGKPAGGVSKSFNTPRNRRRKETINDGNLKYVRLLTPHTRENRWMHSTWHHLPEYRDDDRVNNWSSHYIRPHAAVPRHFVIHPDWG